MKLSVEEIAEIEGFETSEEMLNELIHESCVPACCSEGCIVEPDGTCPHGHPSIFIEEGLI